MIKVMNEPNHLTQTDKRYVIYMIQNNHHVWSSNIKTFEVDNIDGYNYVVKIYTKHKLESTGKMAYTTQKVLITYKEAK
jgi:hypothetical protein